MTTIIDEASDLTEAMVEAVLRVAGPPKATKVAPGVTLFTKDGSQIGNAIVVTKAGQTRDWKQVPVDAPLDSPSCVELLDVWQIETDYGNFCRMTEREILSLFNLGRASSYTQWLSDRADLLERIPPG